MPSYKRYEKPSKWLLNGSKGAAPTQRSHFIADRIFDALFTSTLNVRNFHRFVFDDDVANLVAGGPVNIVLQALKPWPGIDDLKVNINRPFIVVLYDEKTLKPSGQLDHKPDFFEVAFFNGKEGKGTRRSMLRTDLMEIKDLTGELVENITDLNSDNALENQWTLDNLAEEAKKDQSMSDSSLGEWEQGYIIGEALEWTEMEPQPFANWLILPPTLQDPELQAQCEHEWRKATIPGAVDRDGSDAGLPATEAKEIWVCEDCDLIVDENPAAEIEEVLDEDIESEEMKKKMRKIWEDAEKKKKKGSPYDDPPWGDPWKEKTPWKPNPYEPYKPSDDGWDKWVKHNPWMAKYCPDCEDKQHSGDYEAGASA
jgi:hypothetical protein|tara:strand:+ start:935 stop:2041 length:1107 start_codon:yes stop_codon:yes gene_type:complete